MCVRPKRRSRDAEEFTTEGTEARRRFGEGRISEGWPPESDRADDERISDFL